MKKQITIVILTLATLVVVSGCVVKNINEVKDKTANNQTPTQNQTQLNPTTTATGSGETEAGLEEIDISDWQIYRNDVYGFEVSMPREYFDFGFGMEDATQEEYDKAISSLISLKGTNIHNYIEINRYSREEIKKYYLKNDNINDLEFIKNDNGVNYFSETDKLLSPKRINDSRIFCVGEITDKYFICLYVRTEEKNYQQFFDKVISSYKKI